MLHIPELEPTAEDLENIDDYMNDKLEYWRDIKLKDLVNTDF